MKQDDTLIEVVCENNNSTLFIREGATLSELLQIAGLHQGVPYLAAYVDNHPKELSYRLFAPKSVRFINYDSPEGRRLYARSLFFVLLKAINELLPDKGLRMMHPVGRGYYCEIMGLAKPSAQQIDDIRTRMRDIMKAEIPIVRQKMQMQQAMSFFEEHGIYDKQLLLQTRPQFFVSFFNLAGTLGYFYGAMVTSTGMLQVFDIEVFGDGLIMLLPARDNPQKVEPILMQPKLYEVFRQNKEWGDILKISNIGSLNRSVLDGNASELIKVGEALQEKNFARIADTIYTQHYQQGRRLILIAGPSSSGKTTFSKRLAIQLKVLGLEPKMISLDNYFVERGLTPRDENGEYDFECLEALDIESFNNDLNRLFDGEQVSLPKFSFKDGKRYYDDTQMSLNERSVVIVEGIHALNPQLVPHIEADLQFKIYVSALTALAIDNTTTIHTTDNRLLRRLVRDNKYRGRSAYETLKGWESVRRGEDKHIFPYQEQADVMFNTALFFEIAMLARFARPLLQQVPANEPEYAEALRLMKFLGYFVELDDKELPPTSILREFLGDSSFEY